MTTRNIVIVVVILIVLALAWWFFVPQGVNAPANTNATSTQETVGTGNTGGAAGTQSNTSLRALASQTGNFTCSMSALTTGGQSTGTIYGSGGKTRLDFSVQVNGSTYNTHIIRAGGYSYSWVDGQTTGIKTAITTGSSVTPAQGGFISDDSTVSTDCHPWSPDNSLFTPPKGISFVAQ